MQRKSSVIAMHLCQGLIFIWLVFHHASIASAASLRSEYLDTSHHGEIKSPDQKLHNGYVEQSNYYEESDKNVKFRPMLPYERRSRPIFTSKTYFGKNQLHELPREYWAHKEEKTIYPLRGKASRHMHPLKLHHRSPRVEFYDQQQTIPKVQFDEHQVEITGQNVRQDYDEYGPNPGYATQEEYGHPNSGYATKEEYGQPNPGYATKEEYVQPNPGYATKEEYGHPNPGYATKEEYGHPNPGYATKEEYGRLNPGYASKDEYDSKRGHTTNDDELNEDNIEEKGHVHHVDSQLLLSDKDSDFSSLDNDAETSTHAIPNPDFNFDENLKKDELLRNFDEEKFGKIMPSDETSNESEDTTELEEFEGSGSIENDFNALSISDREVNKSARIIDIFSRFNDSAECITPKNESGHCRGLTECPLIETMENFISFLQYICRQRGLLGICCPDNPVIEVKDTDNEKSSEEVELEIEQPPDGCGLSTNTRIVGGTMSVPHEFSWMVALLRRNRFYCGGVIINNWYILTAAHCVLGIKVSDLKVRLGEFDFQQRNEIQQDIPVMEIKRHALFVTSTFQHDIALLKLKRRIEYTKFIGSICLPNNKVEDFSKKNATVAGWGTVSFGGAASPVLRKVTVPVWDNQECDRTYVFERINESFMCAGSSVNGEDACQGDSGGPLMSMNDEGRWEVIGIVSWGRRCGDPTYPGVYTRVTSYLDWIAENAQ